MQNLIIGASGFIGNSIYSSLKGRETIGTYFSRQKEEMMYLDMSSEHHVNEMFKKLKPKMVFLPAFIPGVDYCELNKEACKINKIGVKNIVEASKTYQSKLIFFSSDYIFDGKDGPYLETDQPNPINAYGKTKIECEDFVKSLDNYLIIRTTVVYGYDRESKNFLMTFTEDLQKGKEKKVPIDQFGSPTYIKDLANITIDLVKNGKIGTYNVVGPDYCSRYVFALKIARIFGLNEELIFPITTKELNQAAKRPLRAGLIIDKIRKEINAKPMSIDESLNLLKDKI